MNSVPCRGFLVAALLTLSGCLSNPPQEPPPGASVDSEPPSPSVAPSAPAAPPVVPTAEPATAPHHDDATSLPPDTGPDDPAPAEPRPQRVVDPFHNDTDARLNGATWVLPSGARMILISWNDYRPVLRAGDEIEAEISLLNPTNQTVDEPVCLDLDNTLWRCGNATLVAGTRATLLIEGILPDGAHNVTVNGTRAYHRTYAMPGLGEWIRGAHLDARLRDDPRQDPDGRWNWTMDIVVHTSVPSLRISVGFPLRGEAQLGDFDYGSYRTVKRVVPPDGAYSIVGYDFAPVRGVVRAMLLCDFQLCYPEDRSVFRWEIREPLL